MNQQFSQYYAEFRVIATNLDWNPSTVDNSLSMGLGRNQGLPPVYRSA